MWTWLTNAALAGMGAVPGAGLVVPACAPDEGCWEQAARMEVFGPAPSERGDPLSLGLSVGRDASGLWVQVPELPEGARVEWVLQPDQERDDPTWGGRAQLWHLQSGTHHLETQLVNGETRAFRVQLLLAPDDSGLPRTFTWRPSGVAEPASLWAELMPGSGGLPLLWSREGCEVTVRAPGATAWRVESRPAGPRWHGRGKQRAVRRTGAGDEAVLGCVHGDLTAFATDGERAGWSRLRIQPTVEAPALEGLVPVPREREPDGGVLRVEALLGVAGPAALQGLMVREWARVTRGNLVAAEVGGSGNIALVVDEALEAQAFVLELATDRATVRGGSTAALTWGALALVDLVGFDGTAPTGRFADAPELLRRPLVHRLDGGGRQDFDLERYQAFVERVVARGRYTHLVLDLRARFPWEDRKLQRRSLTTEQLSAVIAHARGLGLQVLPGLDPYGDLQFLLQRNRAWGEDGSKRVRSARQPASLAYVQERVREVLEAFRSPTDWWLDLQWIGWSTQHKRGNARTQRTAATPRWVLLGEELAGWAAWTREQQVVPWMGTGMVLARAQGGRLATQRALASLTEADRERFWWLHDAGHVRALPEATKAGLSLVRLHREVDPRLRPGLQEHPFVGEGLWTKQFSPWSSAPDSVGEVAEGGHWSRVWLTGITGWRPELAEQDADGLLEAWREGVALHPGERPSGRPPIPGEARRVRAGERFTLEGRTLTWALSPTWEQEARWVDAVKRKGVDPVATLRKGDWSLPLLWGVHGTRGRLEGIVVPAFEGQRWQAEAGLDGWTWTTLRLPREAAGAELEAAVDLFVLGDAGR